MNLDETGVVGLAEETEFTIGETDFRVKKLLPMEGFDLLEVVRPGLQVVVDDLKGATDDEADTEDRNVKATEMIVTFIAKLPREIVKEARRVLFTQVEFKNKQHGDWTKLGGREDEGFHKLHPVNVYIVIGRAFAVNFFDFGDDLSSLLDALPIIESPGTRTSPSSSQTSSEPDSAS